MKGGEIGHLRGNSTVENNAAVTANGENYIRVVSNKTIAVFVFIFLLIMTSCVSNKKYQATLSRIPDMKGR